MALHTMGEKVYFPSNAIKTPKSRDFGVFVAKLLATVWVKMWVRGLTHTVTHTRKCPERDKECQAGRCAIYAGGEYMDPFAADLSNAAREIVISSSYIQKNRVESLLPLLTSVPATVYTTPPENRKPEHQSAVAAAIALLETSGVTVIRRQTSPSVSQSLISPSFGTAT